MGHLDGERLSLVNNYQLGETAAAAHLGVELIESAVKHGLQARAESAIVLTQLALPGSATPRRLRELNQRLQETKSSRLLTLLMFSVLVDLCVASGDVELAEHVLAPLLTERDTMHHAEFLLAQGSLLQHRATPNPSSAERSFEAALKVARDQRAKSFELRAATSLAELWQGQGKRAEARQLLGDIYGWFTEGFDTADLKRARALLDRLEGAMAH